MDKVTVSRAVRNLRDRGLVLRAKHKSDGRASLLRLSEDGRAVYDEIAPLATRVELELLDDMAEDEVRALTALLQRLEARAEAMTPSDGEDGGEAS